MKEYIITVAVTGIATAVVRANSEEEAFEISKDGIFHLEYWDINTDIYRGGFRNVREIK